jgi:hypothetical protein
VRNTSAVRSLIYMDDALAREFNRLRTSSTKEARFSKTEIPLLKPCAIL